MNESQIVGELEMLRRELHQVFDQQIEMASNALRGLPSDPESAAVCIRRIASLAMNANHGIRSWRQQSQLVPRIPPMQEEDVEAGVLPLAGTTLCDEPAAIHVDDEVSYLGGPRPGEHLLEMTNIAIPGKEESPHNSSNGEPGGESQTEPEETSTPTDSATVEASAKVDGNPAPESAQAQ